MFHLQHSYGEFGSAKRYGELLRLAATMFFLNKTSQDFLAYMATVADRDNFYNAVPKMFEKLVIHGSV